MCNGHEHQDWCTAESDASTSFPKGKAYRHDAIATAAQAIDKASHDLRDLSTKIHQKPELGFEEHFAHDTLTSYMQSSGFEVTQHAYGLQTAWKATFQHKSGGPTIGVNSEMDALPELGHACGHNLIAIAGVGTALALKEAMLKHDLSGRIVLLGTPAEEGGGGKILLAEAGAYDDMDLCLMAHPTPASAFTPMFARAQAKFEYTGHPAHAALSPEQGLNALDACVAAYNTISMFRQQCSSDVRIHLNILTGKHTINVIPASATLQVSCRSLDMDEFERVLHRVSECAQAGAQASGCEIKETWDKPYQTLIHNMPLANEYALYMQEHQGERIAWSEKPTASTDFGNISHMLPCIHPVYKIPTDSKSQNHTIGFTTSSGTKEAHTATIQAVKGLAAVGCRILTDQAFLKQVQDSFEKGPGQHNGVNGNSAGAAYSGKH